MTKLEEWINNIDAQLVKVISENEEYEIILRILILAFKKKNKYYCEINLSDKTINYLKEHKFRVEKLIEHTIIDGKRFYYKISW